MIINWYGQTCFKIIVQGDKGPVDMFIDPFEKEIGLRPPRIDENSIVIFSEIDKKFLGSKFVITGPGEYDTNGICIQGINAPAKNKERTTIFLIKAEDIKICHLGFLGEKGFAEKEIEEIGDVDILMLPVGGAKSIDAKDALEVMSQIEPKITIPMYYSLPGLKEKIDGLDKFLKSLGIKSPLALPKLSVKKKDLSQDEAKIVVLQP